MNDAPRDRRRLLRLLMLAVFVWGSMLALGAMLFGFDRETGVVGFSPHLGRGLIVELFVLAFLGVWWGLTRRRS
ncbi:MAG: hypothetical protein AB7F89_08905 [Pirellulaceae bacterium]